MAPSSPHSAASAFHKAVEAASRALSGGHAVPLIGKRAKKALPASLTETDRTQIRGENDASALYRRFHDPRPEPTLSRDASGPNAHAMLRTLEQIRCELYGSRHLTGARANLDACLADRLTVLGAPAMQEKTAMPAPLALELLAREALSGETFSAAQAGQALEQWRASLTPVGRAALEEMRATQNDQNRFAHASAHFLVSCLSSPNQKEAGASFIEDDIEEDRSEPSASSETETEVAGEAGTEEAPSPASETVDSVPAPVNANDASTDQKNADDSFQEAPEASASSLETFLFMDLGQEGEMSEDGTEEAAGPSCPAPDNAPSHEPEAYRAYTTAFDEEVLATDLCDPEELSELREELDAQMADTHGLVTRLAHKLQRKLMAQQQRHWAFDQEDGLLDAARLTRIVSTPGLSLSYKRESETDFRDTVVTLLIDNSGSMRGRPIATAALCGDILARTLERCGVKVEVLGFTTRAWKGGQSRAQWLKEGKPIDSPLTKPAQGPGRLNDLRHIVYKSAETPWRRSRHALGLMLREGLLKENIDGEALLWAWKRLKARPEKRRILIVISDGAPVDDSTASANGPDYLEAHLREVVGKLEAEPTCELRAIGIGHDVTRTYANSVTIGSADDLGDTLATELTALFTPQKAPRKGLQKYRQKSRHASSGK